MSSDLSLQKKSKLGAQLKSVFVDFSENTSAHGPPKIVSHKSVLAKLFWVLLFVTGIGVFCYFGYELVSTYLEYDTSTEIELTFDVLEFPAVTFCNLNQFRRDKLPKSMSVFTDDFLKSKREELFGGDEAMEEFFDLHPTVTPLLDEWDLAFASSTDLNPTVAPLLDESDLAFASSTESSSTSERSTTTAVAADTTTGATTSVTGGATINNTEATTNSRSITGSTGTNNTTVNDATASSISSDSTSTSESSMCPCIVSTSERSTTTAVAADATTGATTSVTGGATRNNTETTTNSISITGSAGTNNTTVNDATASSISSGSTTTSETSTSPGIVSTSERSTTTAVAADTTTGATTSVTGGTTRNNTETTTNSISTTGSAGTNNTTVNDATASSISSGSTTTSESSMCPCIVSTSERSTTTTGHAIGKRGIADVNIQREDINGGEGPRNDVSHSESRMLNVQVLPISRGELKTEPQSTSTGKSELKNTNKNKQQAGTETLKRSKRVVGSLNTAQEDIIKDLAGFYEPSPQPQDDEEVWFSNYGSTSSDKTILLNMTQYLSTYDESQLRAAGHSITEMLQECVYLGLSCGPQDFYQFYDKQFGNCYTFNSGMDGKVRKITSPGATFGLSMTVFINQLQYVAALSPEAGLRIMLHRQGEVPLMAEDGFNVAPGTKSGVGVKYVEIERLAGRQFSNCTNDFKRGENGGLHEFYPGNYTQKACLKTCLQKGIISKCGCSNPLYRAPGDVKPCGPKEFRSCVEEREEEMLESDECTSQCPLPCWESQYQYTISTSQWPSNSYEPFLVQALKSRGKELQRVLDDPNEGLKEHFVKVDIYFDNLNYYKYTEKQSMTFEDLVGAIGGHLGLWIGMSIVSFVEVFELCASLCRTCIRIYKDRSKVSSQS